MASELVAGRWVRRLLVFGLGVGVEWASVLVCGLRAGTDLTVSLLVVLVEVIAVAVLSGPVLAALAAFAAVLLVNWYLVPPHHTLRVANPDNLVALVVFPLVAVGAAVLVEVGGRARERAVRSQGRAELLGDVVELGGHDSCLDALERIRAAFDLERVSLRRAGRDGDVVLAATPHHEEARDTLNRNVVDVRMPHGYRLVGNGVAHFAEDRGFLRSLASAAVRAYESEQMVRERSRAEQLAAVDDARSALLASVGHDLRTPLAGLTVAVGALRQLDGELTDAEREELLDTVSAATGRLDELITNLLDMSRLEAGGVAVHLQPCALDEVVARALIGLPAERVLVTVAEDLPDIETDPALLERVVANLVSNALSHGTRAAGDASPPVAVTAEPGADAVVLTVVDHGPGIPSHERERVLQPFERLESTRTAGGTGLGLAIARGFCAALGAGLRLTDTVGGGLTVVVDLPRPAGDRTELGA